MMAMIWYHHHLSIPLNTVHNDSYLVCIEHLSLPSDSGLPMDVANGSDLGLGFDLTVGHGFNLGSSSLVYPSVNDDFDFNPYPQLKKMKTSQFGSNFEETRRDELDDCDCNGFQFFLP